MYATLKVRQHFFNFMILLINNFTEFYCKKQLDPDKMEIENIFDFKRYVEMAYDCNKPFMQEFVRTQGFTNFIEAAYTDEYKGI